MSAMNLRNINSSRACRSLGFTLVEVMIALVIVATALPAFVMLIRAQVDGAAHVREKSYAMWIAENELTRLSMLNNKKRFPTFKLPEKDSGNVEMMGLNWQWQIETTKEDEIPGLVKINIDIALVGVSEGGGYTGAKSLDKLDPLASLTGYMSE